MPAVKKEKKVPVISQLEICSQEKVKEAINVLKILEEKFVEKNLIKQPLLDNVTESFIFLQIILKKIPPPQLLKMLRVSLPHSLMTETSEVCLITGDLEKRNHKAEIEPTVLHYKDLLKKHGVTNVAQVVPLRQLRTEYKTFESKRQLAAAYDVFLVDKKIAGVMPKVLGKSFFHSRKFPIQINLKKLDLKEEIDKALRQVKFSLTCRGNSYALEIARLSMENDAILQNIMASIGALSNKLPGKKNNILSLYLKAGKSKAIPIYVSLDNSSDILIKKRHKNKRIGVDELSTFNDAEVEVFRDGTVKLLKRKKKSGSKENAVECDKDTDIKEPISDDTMEKEDIKKTTANKASFRKKRNKKTGGLNKIADKTELKNKELINVSESDKMSRKKKRGRKSTSLDPQDVVSSLVEDENIQHLVNTEISPKKKKEEKKYIADNISNNEEDNQNISNTSSKKLNLKSKKQKLHENIDVNEKAQNIKGKRFSENENNKIGKKRQSKLFEKSKKENNSQVVVDDKKMEVSSTETMQNGRTPSKSKKRKDENTEAHIIPLLSKTKKVKQIKI